MMITPLLCRCVALAGAFALAATGRAANTQRPNILWLLAEDSGPSAYSCYQEQPAARTPAIDRFASEGVRYTRFYTTAPVCSTARSAFNTGMYATTLGVHHHRTANKQPLPDGVRTLTDWLRAAGYFTANIRDLPAELGFKGTAKTDWNFTVKGPPFDSQQWSDLKGHQPFYAQLSFNETHRAFHGAKRVDPAKIQLPPYYPDDPVVRADYAAYLDSAAELDGKVAKVLAQLERDGLADNTIVIFMGDNGEAQIRGKQFCYEEGLRVPMIVRWPRGIAAPAHYAAGKVDDRLLEAIDVAPTLLDLAGAAIPPKMQGRPFLGARTGAPKPYVFGARDRCDETRMQLRTVRDVRYRYIRNGMPEVPFLAKNDYKAKQYPLWTLLPKLNAEGRLTPAQAAMCAPRQPAEEFYDMVADPHEIRNLVSSTTPEHQAALRRLRGVLDQWVKDTGDRGAFDPDLPNPAGRAP